MNFNLKDIYFGSMDGETEAEQTNFLDLFYDGDGLSDSLKSGKYLIIGRKGTGKTLLAKHFEKTEKDSGNKVKPGLFMH